MWLSKRVRMTSAGTDMDLGVTTIAGGSVGVLTRGEVRNLPVYGPGGYIWLPESGASVLVIKGGPGGEERCVSGRQQAEPPAEMQPGEVYIYGPAGNAVYLRKNGAVELRGNVEINGCLTVNGKTYQPCECEGGAL